ncbi:MAG TPA: serine/threonine-protein kinase [Gemmatimonadaceae bacterium]|jgi:serine/threonine protein kinase|nr:serine/threonine-protein kinase [Gemmatimonadaceae bacterium]
MTEFADQLQDALGPTYQLDDELTGGGMSRVFAAIDRSLNRRVVVKVLPPDLAAGVNRERFRREIQVAAQLQHPHIVPLLSAGEHGDLLWYTMPFIDGESLRAAIERKKSFSAREVVRILHDVVDALAFAHARGVIHRDIKPANILTQGSHALVTDFGVAKAISAALPIGAVTTAGIAIGTPAYMAPEQLAGDPAADHRIDIYAVGLLAYELLTGVSPFTGASPRETLAAQLTRDPAPLHEVAPGVSRNVSTLVMRCLAKDPDARPQSADEILQELDSLTMPFGVTPQTGGVEAPNRKRPWRSVAAVAILAAVLGGVGYAVSRQRDRTTNVGSRPTPPTVTSVTTDTSRQLSPPAAPVLAAPVPPPKPVVSHDDSVRIAAAVEKRVAAAKLRDSIAKAKLAEQTQRKMMDSIIAANSGSGAVAGAGAPRRLIIAEQPEIAQWPEAALLGRAVADSLRRMLRGRSRQYTLVDQDSVRSALTRSRDVTEMGRAFASELLVSIRLTPLPRDSAVLMLQLWDLGASNAYRSRMSGGRKVARNEVLAGLDAVLLSTLTYLDEMSRAPRRPPPAPTPPPSGR